jgi:uncharacterized membrane protein
LRSCLIVRIYSIIALPYNALLSGEKLLAKMRGTKLANCLASVWIACYALVVITTSITIYIKFSGSPTVELKNSHSVRHTKQWILSHLND